MKNKNKSKKDFLNIIRYKIYTVLNQNKTNAKTVKTY